VFDAIIHFSLKHVWFVVAAALVLLGYGLYAARTLPVDVLPEISAPSVTIVTEANAMAPEEVERLVTMPIEQSLQGSPGLRRLRSSSAVGISLVWAEFDWDITSTQARQVVTEKLATARSALPRGIDPVLAPASSVMGEIMFVGVQADGSVDEGELREIAEWSVRRRLLAVEGVAQVVPIGGAVRRVEVVIDPAALVEHRLALDDVLEVLRGGMSSSPGGFVSAGAQEYSSAVWVSRARWMRSAAFAWPNGRACPSPWLTSAAFRWQPDPVAETPQWRAIRRWCSKFRNSRWQIRSR